MKEFNVTIIETLKRIVTVEAETAEDAKDMSMQHGAIANTFLKLRTYQELSLRLRKIILKQK